MVKANISQLKMAVIFLAISYAQEKVKEEKIISWIYVAPNQTG